MKKYIVQQKKMMQFVQLRDAHTHTKKTTNVYIQAHRKKLYNDSHIQHLPKHKMKQFAEVHGY